MLPLLMKLLVSIETLAILSKPPEVPPETTAWTTPVAALVNRCRVNKDRGHVKTATRVYRRYGAAIGGTRRIDGTDSDVLKASRINSLE